jgi:hypothetical protein
VVEKVDLKDMDPRRLHLVLLASSKETVPSHLDMCLTALITGRLTNTSPISRESLNTSEPSTSTVATFVPHWRMKSF